MCTRCPLGSYSKYSYLHHIFFDIYIIFLIRCNFYSFVYTRTHWCRILACNPPPPYIFLKVCNRKLEHVGYIKMHLFQKYLHWIPYYIHTKNTSCWSCYWLFCKYFKANWFMNIDIFYGGGGTKHFGTPFLYPSRKSVVQVMLIFV